MAGARSWRKRSGPAHGAVVVIQRGVATAAGEVELRKTVAVAIERRDTTAGEVLVTLVGVLDARLCRLGHEMRDGRRVRRHCGTTGWRDEDEHQG